MSYAEIKGELRSSEIKSRGNLAENKRNFAPSRSPRFLLLLGTRRRGGGEVPRNPTSSTARRASPKISTRSTAFPGKEDASLQHPKQMEEEKSNQIFEKLNQDPTFLRMRQTSTAPEGRIPVPRKIESRRSRTVRGAIVYQIQR